MRLKFLRNVLVNCEHRAQGTIHEIKDSDALLLIADRAAVRAAPLVETTESPKVSAAETATIKTRKGR